MPRPEEAYDSVNGNDVFNSNSGNNHNNDNDDNNSNDTDENDSTIAHVTSILPLSTRNDEGEMVPLPFYIDMEAAAFLAFYHFNQRSAEVIPELPWLTQNCSNIKIQLHARDSRFSEIEASRHIMELILKTENSEETKLPAAILGAVRSAVSKPLSILGGTLNIPQISPLSTSKSLDERGVYKYFGRVIPTNSGDAEALVEYYYTFLNIRHFSVIYVRDEYGINFVSDILQHANRRKMTVQTAPFTAGVDESVIQAVRKLKDGEFKYFFAVPNGRGLPILLREAYRLGIIGNPQHSWLLSDGAAEYTQSGFSLSSKQDSDLAKAIHGVGVLLVDSPFNHRLARAIETYRTDKQLLKEFIAAHVRDY